MRKSRSQLLSRIKKIWLWLSEIKMIAALIIVPLQKPGLDHKENQWGQTRFIFNIITIARRRSVHNHL